MKSFPLIILITSILVPSVFSQSAIYEKYFHELTGFEDSTGTTQLFYRFSKTDSVYFSSWYRENHVRHFNTATETDSIIFFSTEKEWNLPGYSESFTVDYDFYTNSAENWIQLATPSQGSAPSIYDYRSSSIEFAYPVLLKSLQSSYGYYSPKGLILHPSIDTIYLALFDHVTITFPMDTTFWPDFDNNENNMNSYFDNNHFNYELLAIHPTIDSLYFGINSDGHLFRSDEYSATFELSDSTLYYSDYSELLFDQNSDFIYSKNSQHLLISDNQGRENSWSEITLPDDLDRLLFATTDTSVTGSLFIADSNSVYSSTDFGSSFNKLLDFESEITGLYKKPNSGILYVLTRTDLYKVENGQPTSIKQLPVSRENEPEIPNTVTLHQNFPNPFNPSTTIQFELNEAVFTQLTVYDLLGRKVRELVNEVRPAETNTIQFDATNLASGIYLYRLEANGVVQTRRLALIK